MLGPGQQRLQGQFLQGGWKHSASASVTPCRVWSLPSSPTASAECFPWRPCLPQPSHRPCFSLEASPTYFSSQQMCCACPRASPELGKYVSCAMPAAQSTSSAQGVQQSGLGRKWPSHSSQPETEGISGAAEDPELGPWCAGGPGTRPPGALFALAGGDNSCTLCRRMNPVVRGSSLAHPLFPTS